MSDKKPEGDSLGLRPYGEAVKIGAEAVVGAIRSVCKPASEELGLLLRDRVSYWRACQMIALGEKFRAKMEEKGTPLEHLSVPARIVMKVFEEGSWVEDVDIQSMWAGLLASSCTEDGKDDSNLIFINMLSQMTTPEARLFDFVSRSIVNSKSPLLLEGKISLLSVSVYVDELRRVARLRDVSLVRCVLERLHGLGLVLYQYMGGPNPPGDRYSINLCETGLHLYARCQGCSGSPVEFLGTLK